jgi:predicted RNA-binding protein YlxR (DUF448 family)
MAKRAKGPKPRRIPRRMCIACRESDGKRELIRLVRLADQVVLDETGKRAGRGAYVHPQISCWERALAGSLLQKALRTKIGAENLESLSASVSELLVSGF